jgi:hypothetical protein
MYVSTPISLTSEASEKHPVIYLLFRFAGEPTERIARAPSFTIEPASCGLCRVFGASIERDGCIGSAFVSSIDECLKEQQAFWGNSYPAADHNTIVSRGCQLRSSVMSAVSSGFTRQRSARHPCASICRMPTEIPAWILQTCRGL